MKEILLEGELKIDQATQNSSKIIVTTNNNYEKKIKEYPSDILITSYSNFWNFISDNSLTNFLNQFKPSDIQNSFYQSLFVLEKIFTNLESHYNKAIDAFFIYGSFIEDYNEERDIDIMLLINDKDFFWEPKSEENLELVIKEKINSLKIMSTIQNPIDIAVKFSSYFYERLINRDIFSINAFLKPIFLKDVNGFWKKTSEFFATIDSTQYYYKLSIRLLKESEALIDRALLEFGRLYKINIWESVTKSIDALVLYYGEFPVKPTKLLEQLEKISFSNKCSELNDIILLWKSFFNNRKEMMNPSIFYKEINFDEYLNKYNLANEIINKVKMMINNKC
jgi:hypothetical protein